MRIAVLALTLLMTGVASAGTVNLEVLSTTRPWDFNASLNSTQTYGTDQSTAPQSVGVTAGQGFSIEYLSGLISAYANTVPYSDAQGDTGYVAMSHLQFKNRRLFPFNCMDDNIFWLVHQSLGDFLDELLHSCLQSIHWYVYNTSHKN